MVAGERMVRIFVHGLESSNRGTKSVFFKDRYPDMLTPNFRGDLEARMEKLRGILAGRSGIRMVGSSFGGLMAALFAMEQPARVDRLVLLAPAVHVLEQAAESWREIEVPTWIYHGSRDRVIPLAEVEKAARDAFTDLSFNVVEDDHFLHKTFPAIDWDYLLAWNTRHSEPTDPESHGYSR